MGSITTFGAFTTARLGIYASQLGLSVTGNNIANINNQGYTRQTLDQISLRTSGADRYQSRFDVKVGNGVLCTGVSQIRDPYLDIRYRNELSRVGEADKKLSGLNDLAAILDEIFDGDESKNGVIEAQFMDLLNTLQNLSDKAGQKEYDSQVKSSASALVTLFNSYAKRLEEVGENTLKGFKQDIDSVNKILSNIGELNESIRKSEIHGDSALELRDERNRLIDELSQYMKIDVIYETEEVGAGKTVEKLTIKLGNADPNSNSSRAMLVDGVYVTQVGIGPEKNPAYDETKLDPDPGSFKYLQTDGNGTNDPALAARSSNFDLSLDALTDSQGRVLDNSVPVDLKDNDLKGSLQASRELLTEKGEFASAADIAIDPKAAVKRGIPYYQKSLDLLANKFAAVFNAANTDYTVDAEGFYVDKNGDKIADPDAAGGAADAWLKKGVPLTDAQKTELADNGVHPDGWGNLFSNGGDGDKDEGITAANISISKSWASENVQIVSSYDKDAGSTDQTNVLHLIAQMTGKQDFIPKDADLGESDTPLFHGSFQEMLGNISSVLGRDQRATNVNLTTYYQFAVTLDSSRSSVSGVDLNDEAANMMQYQQSYAAACRLMTTLDEALDKLINGTGVVGR